MASALRPRERRPRTRGTPLHGRARPRRGAAARRLGLAAWKATSRRSAGDLGGVGTRHGGKRIGTELGRPPRAARERVSPTRRPGRRAADTRGGVGPSHSTRSAGVAAHRGKREGRFQRLQGNTVSTQRERSESWAATPGATPRRGISFRAPLPMVSRDDVWGAPDRATDHAMCETTDHGVCDRPAGPGGRASGAADSGGSGIALKGMPPGKTAYGGAPHPPGPRKPAGLSSSVSSVRGVRYQVAWSVAPTRPPRVERLERGFRGKPWGPEAVAGARTHRAVRRRPRQRSGYEPVRRKRGRPVRSVCGRAPRRAPGVPADGPPQSMSPPQGRVVLGESLAPQAIAGAGRIRRVRPSVAPVTPRAPRPHRGAEPVRSKRWQA